MRAYMSQGVDVVNTPENSRHDENPAIAILNVGRMNDWVEQQTLT
jgi:hypothetical protein